MEECSRGSKKMEWILRSYEKKYYTGNRMEETSVKFTHKAYFSEMEEQFKYVEATAYLRENTYVWRLKWYGRSSEDERFGRK